MHTQGAIRGHACQKKRAVGQGRELKFAVHIRMVGDVVPAQGASIVHPNSKVGAASV